MKVYFARPAETTTGANGQIVLSSRGIAQTDALLSAVGTDLSSIIYASTPHTDAMVAQLKRNLGEKGIGKTWGFWDEDSRYREFRFFSAAQKRTPEQQRAYNIAYWKNLDPEYQDGVDAEPFNWFPGQVSYLADETELGYYHGVESLLVLTPPLLLKGLELNMQGLYAEERGRELMTSFLGEMKRLSKPGCGFVAEFGPSREDPKFAEWSFKGPLVPTLQPVA